MKKLRSCLLVLVAVCTIVVGIIVYLKATAPTSALKAALGLKRLPASVEINYFRAESWTDYIVNIDFSISPEDFDELLRGGKFEGGPVEIDEAEPPSGQADPLPTTHSFLFQDYDGWPYAASWAWVRSPVNMEEGYYGDRSAIFVNKERTRVFVSVTAD